MSDVVLINGNVKYSITLDSGVWIFDDRKRHLDEFFKDQEQVDEDLEYQKKMAKQWDTALAEGTIPTTQSEQLFVHKKDISGDWAVPFAPFLANASPDETATTVICHLHTGQRAELSIDRAKNSILCFALDGKPIRHEGPIHLYEKEGDNRENPIKGIVRFEVK